MNHFISVLFWVKEYRQNLPETGCSTCRFMVQLKRMPNVKPWKPQMLIEHNHETSLAISNNVTSSSKTNLVPTKAKETQSQNHVYSAVSTVPGRWHTILPWGHLQTQWWQIWGLIYQYNNGTWRVTNTYLTSLAFHFQHGHVQQCPSTARGCSSIKDESLKAPQTVVTPAFHNCTVYLVENLYGVTTLLQDVPDVDCSWNECTQFQWSVIWPLLILWMIWWYVSNHIIWYRYHIIYMNWKYIYDTFLFEDTRSIFRGYVMGEQGSHLCIMMQNWGFVSLT